MHVLDIFNFLSSPIGTQDIILSDYSADRQCQGSVMQGTGFVVGLVAAALFSSPCTAIRATPARFHDAGVRIRMI
jgi:hypothetical protein